MHRRHTDHSRRSHGKPNKAAQRSLRSALHLMGTAHEFWRSDLNRAAVDLLSPQPGLVLLDVGAGLGPATVEAAKRVTPGGRVIAVDPSRVVRWVLGLRRLWQRARPVIDVRRGTAEELPVPGCSIDGALAVNAAHHFDALEDAATELARVLKPGGRLLLIEEDFRSADHPHRDDMPGAPDPIDPAHVADLLAAAGLSITDSDHRTIGGVPATVIAATKDADR